MDGYVLSSLNPVRSFSTDLSSAGPLCVLFHGASVGNLIGFFFCFFLLFRLSEMLAINQRFFFLFVYVLYFALGRYFTIYDTEDRQGLLEAYHDQVCHFM